MRGEAVTFHHMLLPLLLLPPTPPSPPSPLPHHFIPTLTYRHLSSFWLSSPSILEMPLHSSHRHLRPVYSSRFSIREKPAHERQRIYIPRTPATPPDAREKVSHPHLPITPVQLMRPGVGQTSPVTLDSNYSVRLPFLFREIWFTRPSAMLVL